MPLALAEEGIDRIVLKQLSLPNEPRPAGLWEALLDRINHRQDQVTIHVVGKYVGLEDSYKSLTEALFHGGFHHRLKVNVKWIEAEALEAEDGERALEGADGILVPGGFGNRGTRGMMKAVEIARTRQIPFFGICYGFQWATVEYARNVCGIANADSTEVAPETSDKVIYKLRDLLGVDDLGGTMRLGSYACQLKPGSLSHRLYGADVIHERHRHRYEFNCLYEPAITEKGLENRRPVPRRQVRGDGGTPVAPVVHRGAVPSRVQVETPEATSAVCRLRRGHLQAHARRSRGGPHPCRDLGLAIW